MIVKISYDDLIEYKNKLITISDNIANQVNLMNNVINSFYSKINTYDLEKVKANFLYINRSIIKHANYIDTIILMLDETMSAANNSINDMADLYLKYIYLYDSNDSDLSDKENKIKDTLDMLTNKKGKYFSIFSKYIPSCFTDAKDLLENILSADAKDLEILKNMDLDYINTATYNPKAIDISNGLDSYYNRLFRIDKYEPNFLNKEIISINGYDFNIYALNKKNLINNKFSNLLISMVKDSIIDTISMLPDYFLKKCSINKSNGTFDILLCCNRDGLYILREYPNIIGYYCPVTKDEYNKNDTLTDHIILDCSNSVNYYTTYTIIHELAHVFDSHLSPDDNYKYYTDAYKEKYLPFMKEYSKDLDSIIQSGYDAEEISKDNQEFFAEAIFAYFTYPDDMQILCPDLYDELTALVYGDYDYDYTYWGE